MIRYAKPTTVEEALTLLGEARWRILAGGTDFYPAQGNRPIRDNILDINGLSDLRGVAETESHFVIGARTTWTDIVRHPLPQAFDALKQAAREVGAIQIQNSGTVAGNLCNASPAADGVPSLMVLDAEIELRSSEAGSRWLSLADFILGNRHTALKPDEMAIAIRVPKRSALGGSAFVKLGSRRYLVISIAMAAARLIVGEDGRIEAAAVAVGACSAVAQRLGFLERDLIGVPADGTIATMVEPSHLAALAPIDDVRGSAEYRRDAASEIVGRALVAALPARQQGIAA